MKNNQYGQKLPNEYGQYVSPQNLFNNTPNNPYESMAQPYVKNIYDTRAENPTGNFGAVQLIGGNNNIPNSETYTTRSKGPEFSKYSTDWSGNRFFHSERTGLRPLLDDYITNRRKNYNLPYNPYKKHSTENIRRPSSPSPLEYNRDFEESSTYGLPDTSELQALKNLSSQKPEFGTRKRKTYANVIQQWLNNEGSYFNMLSERPACSSTSEFGCSQFLPNIMPSNSNYGYTNDSTENQNAIARDRKKLYDAYNTKFPEAENQLQVNLLGQKAVNKRTRFNDKSEAAANPIVHLIKKNHI
jgi:hypothetical protein